MKVDMNEVYADLQDIYVKMSPEELKLEYNNGAWNIWNDIFGVETLKIFLIKISKVD